jgi:tRNA 2-thiouridine synthesizing protein A
MEEIKYSTELDCSGIKCPLPILKTKKIIETLQSGEILKMIATDPGSINDTNAWSKRTGNEIISQSHENDVFIYYIRKK